MKTAPVKRLNHFSQLGSERTLLPLKISSILTSIRGISLLTAVLCSTHQNPTWSVCLAFTLLSNFGKIYILVNRRQRRWNHRRDHQDHHRYLLWVIGLLQPDLCVNMLTLMMTGKSNNISSNPMTRNPHTSLSLFEEHPPESNPETPRAAIIPHRASAKPPPRNYNELFVGNESDGSPCSASKGKSFSGGPQTSEEQLPTKAGAGKHYQPSRLFDDDTSQAGYAAEQVLKPNSKKYQHFDLAGGEDGNEQPKPSGISKARAAKQMSHWDFEDFVTPQIPIQRLRSQDIRHFGWSDDDVNQDSPVKPKRTVQPRRDVETHFELQGEGTPQEEKTTVHRQKGSSVNNGLGLYMNNLYGEEDETGGISNKPNENGKQTHQPLDNVTNINNHRKTFGSQFTMTDDSPASQENKHGAEEKKSLPADRRAAVKMMNSSWDTYDESPEQQQSKDNVMTKKKTTGGDGMGGRAGLQRQWGFGDESGGDDDVRSQPKRGKMQISNRTTSTGGDGGGFWGF